jgi:hypothetical protein
MTSAPSGLDPAMQGCWKVPFGGGTPRLPSHSTTGWEDWALGSHARMGQQPRRGNNDEQVGKRGEGNGLHPGLSFDGDPN